MISAVQRQFANLGMAKKLGLGFTLVLLLTALIAAIGVWSLQTIGQRFEAAVGHQVDRRRVCGGEGKGGEGTEGGQEFGKGHVSSRSNVMGWLGRHPGGAVPIHQA